MSTAKAYAHMKDHRGKAEGYRSGLEYDIALSLQAGGYSFEYEQQKIKFTQPAKKRSYTPDFVVTTRSGKKIVIESKGYFKKDDRMMHLHIRASNPDIEVRFIFSNPKTKIYKGSPTSYADWCDKNGFMYATFNKKHPVPVEWLEE